MLVVAVERDQVIGIHTPHRTTETNSTPEFETMM